MPRPECLGAAFVQVPGRGLSRANLQAVRAASLSLVSLWLLSGPAVASAPLCPPEPRESAAQEAAWNRALARLPALTRRLPPEADRTLLMPVDGVRVRDVTDTWGGARPDARQHAGQDIFARAGTYVRSAVAGVVWRTGRSANGGEWVYVVGAGGRQYYYAHLGRVNRALKEGLPVTARTILGTVGNTGNAENTPPHLHFAVFMPYRPGAACRFLALDPLPLLRDR